MKIDPHVHCRDEDQAYKATVAEVLELAHSQGIDTIFDMPNVDDPVTNRVRVTERLNLVPKGEEDCYRLYIGLTGEESQLEEAIWCYENIPEVIGFKLFAGKSVGDLSVTDVSSQRMIYRVLSQKNYQGVITIHCEKEALLKPELWDPANPISHSYARPKEAEIESVRDQILFTAQEEFEGHIHICHVSCSESVSLINEAKDNGLRISCGVTPHHLMWDNLMMNHSEGLLYKMNPPLRDSESVTMLHQQLLLGMIDVIETDHAPHTLKEKMGPPYLSGYPSLELYNQFVTEFLPGIGLSQRLIEAMTYSNIIDIWSGKLKITA